MSDAEALKKLAGEAACLYVKSGMNVGLGTGSTVKYTVLELGRRIRDEGLEIVGVPTSVATEQLANEVGIPLVELGSVAGLDIVIDGTDEFDPQFQLIKGGGAACDDLRLGRHAAVHLLDGPTRSSARFSLRRGICRAGGRREAGA